MERQTQKLKLNVTNIKSFLISSNEKLRKLEFRKSSIIRNENKKIEKRNLEERAEKTKIKTPVFKSIFAKVGGVVKSLKDGIIGFFGYLLLGFLVNKLPQIIASIKHIFVNRIQPIWNGVVKALSFISNGISSIYNVVGGLFGVTDVNRKLRTVGRDLSILNKTIDYTEGTSTSVVGQTSSNSDMSVDNEVNAESRNMPISSNAEIGPQSIGINIPELKTGGEVVKPGLAYIHKNETIITEKAAKKIEEQTGFAPQFFNQLTETSDNGKSMEMGPLVRLNLKPKPVPTLKISKINRGNSVNRLNTPSSSSGVNYIQPILVSKSESQSTPSPLNRMASYSPRF